ncbi:MAG: penicillin-insensitive murein endopeptidase [Gammaproteobacteria bacterium]|nr:penicillin-insensitive murein endopeptidase [Gammaproteobacteria bacterium]MBQ0774465.1 penicillin-insensitive murein endopeptidase [Gammaproteobacteria bacterium]
MAHGESKINNKRLAAVLILTLSFASACAAETEPQTASICHGNYANGSLEHGKKLPSHGENFKAYSSLGVQAGRTYVHSKVYDVIVDAYKTLKTTAPGKLYIYGETGLETGGRFRPHKTHQNGLSVDFFVPVLNKRNESVALPIGITNKLGYNIEFDQDARFGELRIDFDAMAEHLLALRRTAEKNGVGIRVAIFDNTYQPRLMATATGKKLPTLLRFSVSKPWVRHDEHYHVDFIAPCQ